jgi:hypothetical protein
MPYSADSILYRQLSHFHQLAPAVLLSPNRQVPNTET